MSSSRLDIRVPDELFQRVDHLATRTQRSRSSVAVDALQQYVTDKSPLESYLRDHPGLDLGLRWGGFGRRPNDPPERGRVIAFLFKLADANLPDWDEKHEAAWAAYNEGEVEPMVTFTAALREIIESADRLATITGTRPWEDERDEIEHYERDRREHPEHWVPIAEAVATYKRLDTQNRGERRAFGREARARGAGRPAGRRKGSSSGDRGDDGDGEGSDSPRGAA